MQNASELRAQTATLLYGSLTAISVILLQPFITPKQTDSAATVALIAFAVGIPFTAIGVFVGRLASWMRKTPTEENSTNEADSTKVKGVITVTAPMTAVGVFSEATGIVAALWHASPIAGIVFLSCGIIASFVWRAWDNWLIQLGKSTAK